MNFLLLASSLAFFAWFTVKIRQVKKDEARRDEEYWAREARADNTRRKSLDDLAYIAIPFDGLPMETMADDEKVAECHGTLRVLAEKPIVNLSGLTNTDLKLRYGAPNITALSRYDSAYTTLARTLQSWAAALHGGGHAPEARAVLEFAVATRSDVSGTYYLLADIYRMAGEEERIAGLAALAGGLESGQGKLIAARLEKEMTTGGTAG